MQKLKQSVCVIACALALAGCASSPATSINPVVQGPQMSPPAAWAMAPSRSMQAYQSVFSISGMLSPKTTQR